MFYDCKWALTLEALVGLVVKTLLTGLLCGGCGPSIDTAFSALQWW